ncbi:hypothetical protein Tco_0037113 [Tanacetum coccineum]
MTELPFVDSGFAVPVFSPGDDLIACLNKAMAFLTVFWGETMQVDMQGLLNATTVKLKDIWLGNVLSLSDQGMQHGIRKKAMLAKAQEAGQILDEEQLIFLADLGVPDGQAVQTIIPNNVAFQIKDLDTYDSDCDDISNAKAILMANIFIYGSDVILEAQQDSMILFVIEQMSEQMIDHVNNKEKANKEHNNESITAELEIYKEQVKTFEQRLNIDLSSREKND